MAALISIEEKNDVVIATIVGSTIEDPEALCEALKTVTTLPRRLLINCEAVTTLSKQAREGFCVLAKAAMEGGKKVGLYNLQERVEFVIRFVGMEVWFDIYQTAADALADPPQATLADD